jgi:ferredoxin
MGVTVTTRCKGCGACLLTCPEHAIRPRAGWAARGEGPLEVRADLCTGCGECLEICPADAIEDPPTPDTREIPQ